MRPRSSALTYRRLGRPTPADAGAVLTLLAIRLLLFALDEYARREHLYSQEEADQDLQTERRQLWPVLTAYVIAILVGLALPRLAVALYFVVAVYLLVPFRDLRRLLFSRSQLPLCSLDRTHRRVVAQFD